MAETLYDMDGDGIAVITINNPRRRNAMTYPMIEELYEGLQRASDEARAVIIIGEGDTFCAGIDLNFLANIPPEERGIKVPPHDADGWWNITSCPLPVIAAVDGSAVGMGAEWTSHCDVRIATNRARFAWNFSHRGLVPDTGAGTWLLPRQIGLQNALRLMYSGDWLDAKAALEIGYICEIVEPSDLLSAAKEEARRYLLGAPSSHRLTKRLLYEGLHLPVAEHQAISRQVLLDCFESEEHLEGLTAFSEGRTPNFKDLK
jgi:enoyl-CoA hydratase/carnithine racemase